MPPATIPNPEPTPILEPPVRRRPLTAIILLGLASLLVLSGGVWAAVHYSAPTPALTCTPPTASTLSASVAQSAYTRMIAAIRVGNQSCVDSLTSADLTTLQSAAMPQSKGNWVGTSQATGGSWTTRAKLLPSALLASSFTQSTYTPAATINNVASHSAEAGITSGLSIGYPVQLNGQPCHLVISFVLDSGQVRADAIEITSDALAPTPTISPVPTPTATPSPVSTPKTSASKTPVPVTVHVPVVTPITLSSDTITLVEANVRLIHTILGAYQSDYGYYPATATAASLAHYNPSPSDFTAPAGTTIVYVPSPAGCTTAAHNCQGFTLSAVNNGNNVAFYTVTDATP